MNFVDLCSGIFDNLCYLNRIKLKPYSNKWQEKWVDYLSSACALTFVVLSIIEKLIAVYREATQKYNDVLKVTQEKSKRAIRGDLFTGIFF